MGERCVSAILRGDSVPRQGKQLNIWIPDQVMAALEAWILEQGTTKTDGVIQAIQVLTGTHPEAPPDLRAQVAELRGMVENLRSRLDRLEGGAVTDLQERVTGLEQAQWDAGPQPRLATEIEEVLSQMGTTWEAATPDQLKQITKTLRIRVSRSATPEQLRHQIQAWTPPA